MKHSITYLCPFLIEGADFDPVCEGWKPHVWPSAGAQSYSFKVYFPRSIVRMFGEYVSVFARDDFSSVYFAGECYKAYFRELVLFRFPAGIYVLAFRVEFAGTGDADLPLDDEAILDAHACYRRLRPEYATVSESGAPQFGGFHEAVFQKYDGSRISFCLDSSYFRNPLIDRAVPWCVLICPERFSRTSDVYDITYVSDTRLPSVVFVASSSEFVPGDSYIYRLISGDSSQSTLPNELEMRRVVTQNRINAYFFEGDPRNSSQIFAGSHHLVAVGSEANSFFVSVVKNNHETLYFALFVLSWYQYSYLIRLLEKLQDLGEVLQKGGSPFARAVDRNQARRLIEGHSGVFMPSVIGEAAMPTQLTPIKRALTESLRIEEISTKVRAEIEYIYQAENLGESVYLSRVAFYIGITAVIGLCSAIFFGILSADGEKVIQNVTMLPGSIRGSWTLLGAVMVGGLVLTSGIAILASQKNRFWNAFIASATYVGAVAFLMVALLLCFVV